MRAGWLAILVLGLGLGVLGFVSADDEKKTGATKDKDSATKKEDMKKDKEESKTEKTRLKGQLPPNYRKLALSEEQIQKVYKVQADYDKKLSALEEQLKKLKADEKKEIESVLTAAQKARLKEILAEKD